MLIKCILVALSKVNDLSKVKDEESFIIEYTLKYSVAN